MSRTIYLLLILSFAFFGCEKEAGEGGQASITGKLYVYKYNGNCTELRDEYYGVDERVYIIANDAPSYFDNVRTGPDGTFWFPYLRKGNYRIYAISKNCDIAGQDEAVFLNVEITGRKQDLVTGNLEIIK